MEATTEFSSEKRYGNSDHDKLAAGENFIVEELLDFSNDDLYVAEDGGDGGIEYRIAGRNSSADGSMVCNVGENSNLSSSGNDQKRFSDGDGSGESAGDTTCYSSELCVPYDEEAELEWLSTITDESYPKEEFQNLQLISKDKVIQSEANEGSKIHVFKPNQAQNQSNTDTSTELSDGNKPNPIFDDEIPVPAKARSKRSRNTPCSWSSRLEVLSTPTLTNSIITTTTISTTTEMSSTVPDASSSNVCPKLVPKPVTKRIKTIGENISIPRANNEGRRCLHCATDKTPQWRTGPMGPKTLCNACGVRYKSGRLVPEYRPAASPTFVMTKHSNSHRKVMELRRQKELIRQQKQFEQQQQLIHMFDVSDADDYLIHHHSGPDFRQLY